MLVKPLRETGFHPWFQMMQMGRIQFLNVRTSYQSNPALAGTSLGSGVFPQVQGCIFR